MVGRLIDPPSSGALDISLCRPGAAFGDGDLCVARRRYDPPAAEFILEELPAGEYQVVIELKGHAARRVAVQLEPGRLKVALRGVAPEALFVHLAHGTRAGHDLRLRLTPNASGIYEAELPALPAGRWGIALEDPRGVWRLVKEAA